MKVKHPEGTVEKMLLRASGTTFYNTSKLDFEKLKGDPNHIAPNLTSYIKGFSANARDVIEQFKFADQIAKLDESNLLFQVVAKFADVDLHPDKVPNHVMGSIFEETLSGGCASLDAVVQKIEAHIEKLREYRQPARSRGAKPCDAR